MAANDVQIQIIGRDMASGAFRSVYGSAQNLAGGMNSLGGAMSLVNRTLVNSASIAGGIAGYQGLSSAIQTTIGSAFAFAKSMETNELGMAGILVSMAEIDGRTIAWGEALAISKGTIKQLNDEALRTAATSEELVNAYRALLAPGLAAKMNMDQILQLTVTGANAVKSLGLNNTQVVQELRDLVQGGIQPASSTLATALGLKDADIKAAKESSEGLFTFLMERLKGFEISSGEYAKTWTGVTEQIQEGITRAGASGMEPLFSAIKSELADVAGYITTVNQETGKIQINPEVVSVFRSIADTTLFISAHAKEAAIAFVAWKTLSAVALVMGDIRSVTAGANIAQTFLGKAALQVRTELEAQALAGKLAGATIETASVAASMGQYQLASAILAVNGAHVKSGTAATAAGAATVTAMGVGRTAAGNMLSTVWALAGGWVGVAIAAGFAIKALIDYEKNKNRIDSYNTKAEVFEENGSLYKNTEIEEEMYSKALGRNIKGKVTRKVELTPEEYRRHYDWKNEQARIENSDPEAEKEKSKKELEELMKKLTGKFPGAGDDGKAAEKAYEEAQRLTDKIADMIAKMDNDIRGKTETAYQSSTGKLTSQTENIKRELEKSKLDFAKYGIDVSDVYTKITEYQEKMAAEIEKTRGRALTSLRIETGATRAERTGNLVGQADSDYRATILRLEKEKEDKFKEVAKSKSDKEALKAVDDWYLEQVKLAEQKKVDGFRDARIKEYDIALQHNSLLVTLEGTSVTAVDAMNKRQLDSKIEYLRVELLNATLTSEKRLQLENELAGAIEKRNDDLAKNIATAGGVAYSDLMKRSTDYRDIMVGAFDDINNHAEGHFVGMLTGAESFSKGIKGIAADLKTDIITMFAKMAYELYIMNPIKSWFSTNILGIGGGSASSLNMGSYGTTPLSLGVSYPTLGGYAPKATGGSVEVGKLYQVNEPWGPYGGGTELFQPSVSGRIVPANKSQTMSQETTPSIQVNIANNSGQEIKTSKQQVSYNSEMRAWVIDVVVTSTERNEGGMRDSLSSSLGVAR